MKQVAVDLKSVKTCLFFERLSEAAAAELRAETAEIKDKIFVFIDNLIDSRAAIQMLVATKNSFLQQQKQAFILTP